MNNEIQLFLFLKSILIGFGFCIIYNIVNVFILKLDKIVKIAFDFILYFLLGLCVFVLNLRFNNGQIAFFGLFAILIGYFIGLVLVKIISSFASKIGRNLKLKQNK